MKQDMSERWREDDVRRPGVAFWPEVRCARETLVHSAVVETRVDNCSKRYYKIWLPRVLKLI